VSADNYIYVRRREDGKFGVSMRFASVYYSDEGNTVESVQGDLDSCEPGKYRVDDDWIAKTPADHYGVFDDASKAVEAAHRAKASESIVEYGVAVAPDVFV
jgi:hypothetical protein